MGLTIEVIHNPASRGPNGEPMLFGTLENPAKIEGQVVFQTDEDLKGQDVQIDYTAHARVSWMTRGGNGISFDCQSNFDHKKITMGLRYRQPGVIQAGRYSARLNFPIDPTRFPTSMTLRHGAVQYKIVATLPRKFPNKDIVVEQLVYVINASLPSPFYPEKMVLENPSLAHQFYNPIQWTAPWPFAIKEEDEFSGARPPATHLCEAPSMAFIAGECFPIAISTLVDVPAPVPIETAKGSKKSKGFFSKILNGPGSNEKEVVWPNTFNLVPEVISVRLEQNILYKDHGGEASMPEIREFELLFNMPGTQEGENPEMGFMTILLLVLPQVADQHDHLKPSMSCKALDIKHSLKVNLKFKAITHKLQLPITISAPTHPGRPIPYRFQAVNWAGSLAIPQGMQPMATPPASFAQVGVVRGTVNGIFHALEASQITKWSMVYNMPTL
ncbi:hypothetical protein EMPS_06194 [Entomortierella parvispora]|uniref:Arrestin-like N-terminal domain-containing protein n=1 Tax=Entomortierella parvispora TaxID=205924 RepID=A0A9P3HBU7_9FUNG|nr:hypothetical protein EMPS_06194 [Entomortierella parvispora]